jgi:NAD(P) transhydrogenase subunit beta
MSTNLAAVGYLIAAVCFIMALRGLSSAATSRAGNRYGMAGMTLAIVITLLLLTHASAWSYVLILAGLVIGGGIGFVVARRIEMTAMPQLVAAFHSLVGLAAVFVATAAFLAPHEFHITNPDGTIEGLSLLEMGLGTIIGAITFSGSLIAFGKLQSKLPPSVESALGPLKGIVTTAMSSRPILLPGRHAINIAVAAAIVLLLVLFIAAQHGLVFFLMLALAFAIGFLLIIPIGGADMPVVVSMLHSY